MSPIPRRRLEFGARCLHSSSRLPGFFKRCVANTAQSARIPLRCNKTMTIRSDSRCQEDGFRAVGLDSGFGAFLKHRLVMARTLLPSVLCISSTSEWPGPRTRRPLETLPRITIRDPAFDVIKKFPAGDLQPVTICRAVRFSIAPASTTLDRLQREQGPASLVSMSEAGGANATTNPRWKWMRMIKSVALHGYAGFAMTNRRSSRVRERARTTSARRSARVSDGESS